MSRFQHFIISSLPQTPNGKAVKSNLGNLSNLVDLTDYISEKQFNLKSGFLFPPPLCYVDCRGKKKKIPPKPRVVQVNEFTLAYLQLPGSLIRRLAEHSRFCLDGSQMETHVWSRAKLSALRMICSVNDGRLLG